VTELERALVVLGRELDLPPAPALAAAVRPRLARGSRRRLWLALAAAVLLAVAVALAVPPARSAILRFFHIRGAQVSIVDRLPAVPLRGGPLGTPGTLGQAGFRVLLPHGQRPDAVYLFPGGVWLRYGTAAHPRLLLAELETGSGLLIKKVAAGSGRVEYVDVGGSPGVWVAVSHVLYLPGGEPRLAGNTLLWQHGALTLRLEGKLTKAQATAIALAVR
jgi:hypothetical protein